MSKVRKRFGLYGEGMDILLPDFMHCETIEFRSRKHDWVIDVHSHAHLYQVFLIESGTVHFQYDNQEIILKEPCLLTIPENILHGFEFSENIEGKVLTMTQAFIETIFSASPKVPLELNQVLILSNIAGHQRFSTIGRIIHRLYDELRDELPEKKLALQCYFTLLLTEIYRLHMEKSERKNTMDNRNALYFSAFRQNIRQSRSAQKTIREYAHDLRITDVHLNRVCKQVAGMTASQVVQQFFILEAEKHLLHTEYSISEIAYMLNYKDPAYFSRLFKGVTGKSPKEFRRG